MPRMPVPARPDVFYILHLTLKHNPTLGRLLMTSIQSPDRIDIGEQDQLAQDVMLLLFTSDNELCREEAEDVLTQVLRETDADTRNHAVCAAGEVPLAASTLADVCCRWCDEDALLRETGRIGLQHVFQMRTESRGDILGRVFAGMSEATGLGDGMRTADTYCRLFEGVCADHLVLLADAFIPDLIQWLSFLDAFPVSISQRIIQACVPLMPHSHQFQDTLTKLLQKQLQQRSRRQCEVGVSGFLSILEYSHSPGEQAEVAAALLRAFLLPVPVRGPFLRRLHAIIRRIPLHADARATLLDATRQAVQQCVTRTGDIDPRQCFEDAGREGLRIREHLGGILLLLTELEPTDPYLPPLIHAVSSPRFLTDTLVLDRAPSSGSQGRHHSHNSHGVVDSNNNAHNNNNDTTDPSNSIQSGVQQISLHTRIAFALPLIEAALHAVTTSAVVSDPGDATHRLATTYAILGGLVHRSVPPYTHCIVASTLHRVIPVIADHVLTLMQNYDSEDAAGALGAYDGLLSMVERIWESESKSDQSNILGPIWHVFETLGQYRFSHTQDRTPLPAYSVLSGPMSDPLPQLAQGWPHLRRTLSPSQTVLSIRYRSLRLLQHAMIQDLPIPDPVREDIWTVFQHNMRVAQKSSTSAPSSTPSSSSPSSLNLYHSHSHVDSPTNSQVPRDALALYFAVRCYQEMGCGCSVAMLREYVATLQVLCTPISSSSSSSSAPLHRVCLILRKILVGNTIPEPSILKNILSFIISVPPISVAATFAAEALTVCRQYFAQHTPDTASHRPEEQHHQSAGITLPDSHMQLTHSTRTARRAATEVLRVLSSRIRHRRRRPAASPDNTPDDGPSTLGMVTEAVSVWSPASPAALDPYLHAVSRLCGAAARDVSGTERGRMTGRGKGRGKDGHDINDDINDDIDDDNNDRDIDMDQDIHHHHLHHNHNPNHNHHNNDIRMFSPDQAQVWQQIAGLARQAVAQQGYLRQDGHASQVRSIIHRREWLRTELRRLEERMMRRRRGDGRRGPMREEEEPGIPTELWDELSTELGGTTAASDADGNRNRNRNRNRNGEQVRRRPGTGARGGNRGRVLRSRNPYVQEGLTEMGERDDTYADLEDFIVCSDRKRRRTT